MAYLCSFRGPGGGWKRCDLGRTLTSHFPPHGPPPSNRLPRGKAAVGGHVLARGEVLGRRYLVLNIMAWNSLQGNLDRDLIPIGL